MTYLVLAVMQDGTSCHEMFHRLDSASDRFTQLRPNSRKIWFRRAVGATKSFWDNGSYVDGEP